MASVRLINTWVQGATREKIKELMKPDMLSDLTKLVLVNAIYFKGSWASKFDGKRTTEQVTIDLRQYSQDFHLSDGKTKKVWMMEQTAKFYYGAAGELDAALLELPYTGDRLTLLLVLPTSASVEGLEQKLKTSNIYQTFEKVKRKQKVSVSLPKFKMEQTIPLMEHLRSLGMTDMFDPAKANFSAIDGSRQLHVSAVVQKVFFEVNEEGSEAAAATGAVMGITSIPEEFSADRPFLFFLRDSLTGMVVFQGRVTNPEA